MSVFTFVPFTTGTVADRISFDKVVENEKVPSFLVSTYFAPTISGTTTGWFIDMDRNYSAFTNIKDCYFTTQYFENKFSMTSKEAYNRWEAGEVSGTDYSSWVSAYISVWDKIKES
jgi:hypothetical protein